MKQRIILLMMLLSPLFVYAQSQRHMKFLGVNVTGTVEEVAGNLIDKGFTIIPDFDTSTNAKMLGTYLNRACNINIGHDQYGDVLHIHLKFNKVYKSMNSTAYKKDFNAIKKQLEAKYGKLKDAFSWPKGIYSKDFSYGSIQLASTWADSNDYNAGYVIDIIFADKTNGRTVVNF